MFFKEIDNQKHWLANAFPSSSAHTLRHFVEYCSTSHVSIATLWFLSIVEEGVSRNRTLQMACLIHAVALPIRITIKNEIQ